MRVWGVGGGPSLQGYRFESLRQEHVIAVNGSYRDVPWAQHIIFSDRRFWQWNHMHPVWQDFTGRKITTWQHNVFPGCEVWQSYVTGPLSTRPGMLAGKDSGTKAVNLAVLLGATRIELLGFDMKPNGNYHDYHELKNRQNSYGKFVEAFEAMGQQVLARGIRVTNWCADSGATVYERRDWRDAIPSERGEHPAA